MFACAWCVSCFFYRVSLESCHMDLGMSPNLSHALVAITRHPLLLLSSPSLFFLLFLLFFLPQGRVQCKGCVGTLSATQKVKWHLGCLLCWRLRRVLRTLTILPLFLLTSPLSPWAQSSTRSPSLFHLRLPSFSPSSSLTFLCRGRAKLNSPR